jgi:hypothetical protein
VLTKTAIHLKKINDHQMPPGFIKLKLNAFLKLILEKYKSHTLLWVSHDAV